MSGLKLGDLIFDPRRVVYIPSLKAVVCSGLLDALKVSIVDGLRAVLERVDAVIEDHRPESLVILGSFTQDSALRGLMRRWGKRTKIHLVADSIDSDARDLAETLGAEVHHELVWGQYRFVTQSSEQDAELQLFTVIGKPNYSVRVGRRPFGGMKLAVFLK
ncbi:MAG: hypothetical protein AB1540_17165, partial [Bdellovibrionota bacterium]